jgi:hypothetical protein
MSLQSVIFKINPKYLFLVDSLGALLSAFLLGIVLVEFEPVFGLPARVLHILALIACCFAVYSFFCFVRLKEKWRPFMRIIAIANLLYCALTFIWVLVLHDGLTALGITYFVLEIIIVVTLAIIELRVAAQSTHDVLRA